MNSNRDPHHTGSIIDLYTKIPDYSEVQHLGNSEFINKIEQLKEEFRQIRASLYEDSDVECLAESTRKVLNIGNRRDTYEDPSRGTKVIQFSNPAYRSTFSKFRKAYDSSRNNESLFIRSCDLHRNPYNAGMETFRSGPTYGPPEYSKSDPAYRQPQYDGKQGYSPGNNKEFDNKLRNSDSDDSSHGSTISRWSSSPEIYTTRRKEYLPPANIEKRLTFRRPQKKAEQVLDEEDSSRAFRAHPVPSHVYEPLFDKIMLKNHKRSQKVRAESKQKLLAQVKPFSFTKPSGNTHGFGSSTEILNNKKPVKLRKCTNTGASNIKTSNNKLSAANMFRANPAPPRTRALMSALRLREQQEYRDLKRRLRSEALMKTASLPPGMAARDKSMRANESRLHAILAKFEASSSKKHRSKNRHASGTDDDEATYTDEDRMSENSFASNEAGEDGTVRKGTQFSKDKNSQRYASSPTIKNFTSDPVFESTSNDNHASRLRVIAAKRKEEARIQREEEEQFKVMRSERKRQKLRDSHLHVWRRACSYSSNQDIAMRRQLRVAASILERECFRKDMSTMLCRVRSAPLLLEGVRKRRFEPCKKHRQELLQLSDRSSKFNTPRLGCGRDKYYSRINWTSHGDEPGGEFGPEKSETAAMAEGSLTNSDNESVKNIQLDTEEEDDEGQDRGLREINLDLHAYETVGKEEEVHAADPNVHLSYETVVKEEKRPDVLPCKSVQKIQDLQGTNYKAHVYETVLKEQNRQDTNWNGQDPETKVQEQEKELDAEAEFQAKEIEREADAIINLPFTRPEERDIFDDDDD